MVNKKTDVCPLCGGELQSRGKVRRLVRMKNGEKKYYFISRYSCKECKHWHRVLPDVLIPYKQYPKKVIEGFIDGSITNDDLDFEDYPCEITQKRWMTHK